MKNNRPKVLVAVNTLTAVGMGPYMDHMNLAFRLGQISNKYEFHQMHSQRISVDRFRNWVAQTALALEAKYVLFIDDDMRFESVTDLFTKLIASNYQIISALNYIRGYPFDIMGFRYEDKKKTKLRYIRDDEIPAKPKVIDAVALGTAVCLIDTEVFQHMPEPYFATGPNNTEDVYFCLKATDYWKAKFGKTRRIRIGMHTGVITGHVLDPEVISYRTKKSLLAYYESFGYKNEKKEIDRGEAYVAENIEPRLRDKSA